MQMSVIMEGSRERDSQDGPQDNAATGRDSGTEREGVEGIAANG